MKEELLAKEITNDILKMISAKNVDLKKLSFLLGTTIDNLYKSLGTYNKDISFYLEAYCILNNWAEV